MYVLKSYFTHIVICLWQVGGFSLEMNNTNPSNVMVGIRVLVGSQSVDRAPSYIDIFGRTLPVHSAFLQTFFCDLEVYDIKYAEMCVCVLSLIHI